MKITQSKRLRFSALAMIANYIIFAFGIHRGADLSALGAGLALINTPLFAYVMGDTIRASKKNCDE